MFFKSSFDLSLEESSNPSLQKKGGPWWIAARQWNVRRVRGLMHCKQIGMAENFQRSPKVWIKTSRSIAIAVPERGVELQLAI